MKKILVILSLFITTSAFAEGDRVLKDNLKNSMQAQTYDMIKNSTFSCKQTVGDDRKLSQTVMDSAVEKLVLEVLSKKLDAFEYIDSSDGKGNMHFIIVTKEEVYNNTRRVFSSTVFVPLSKNLKVTTFNFNFRLTAYNATNGKVQADDYTFRAECTFR